MEKLGPVSADVKAPEDAKAEKLFQALPVESMQGGFLPSCR